MATRYIQSLTWTWFHSWFPSSTISRVRIHVHDVIIVECYPHKVKCSHQTTICQNLVQHSVLIYSFQKPNAILKNSFLTAAVFCASLSSLASEAGEDRSWETQSQILDFQRILGSFCSLKSFLICGRYNIYWRWIPGFPYFSLLALFNSSYFSVCKIVSEPAN